MGLIKSTETARGWRRRGRVGQKEKAMQSKQCEHAIRNYIPNRSLGGAPHMGQAAQGWICRKTERDCKDPFAFEGCEMFKEAE
jgi:hypothetical protein